MGRGTGQRTSQATVVGIAGGRRGRGSTRIAPTRWLLGDRPTALRRLDDMHTGWDSPQILAELGAPLRSAIAGGLLAGDDPDREEIGLRALSTWAWAARSVCDQLEELVADQLEELDEASMVCAPAVHDEPDIDMGDVLSTLHELAGPEVSRRVDPETRRAVGWTAALAFAWRWHHAQASRAAQLISEQAGTLRQRYPLTASKARYGEVHHLLRADGADRTVCGSRITLSWPVAPHAPDRVELCARCAPALHSPDIDRRDVDDPQVPAFAYARYEAGVAVDHPATGRLPGATVDQLRAAAAEPLAHALLGVAHHGRPDPPADVYDRARQQLARLACEPDCRAQTLADAAVGLLARPDR